MIADPSQPRRQPPYRSSASRPIARPPSPARAAGQPMNVDLVQSGVTLLHIHDCLKGMPGVGGDEKCCGGSAGVTCVAGEAAAGDRAGSGAGCGMTQGALRCRIRDGGLWRRPAGLGAAAAAQAVDAAARPGAAPGGAGDAGQAVLAGAGRGAAGRALPRTGGHGMSSHETICQSSCLCPCGGLRRELAVCLWSGRAVCRRGQRRRSWGPDRRCGPDRPATCRGRWPAAGASQTEAQRPEGVTPALGDL
jgi:hypothetical protein